MPRRSPGARAKGIGAELRQLREDRQLKLTAVASQLGWDKSRLSRIEHGQQNQTVEDVAQLLVVYGVTDEPAQERMFDAVRSVDEPGWWEKVSGVTKTSAALADYETEASELISWSPKLLPGRVQTMDYASAFMETSGLGSDQIGLRLAARRERQRAVADRPYLAFLGEEALRALNGGPRVMAAQLDALLERQVTVRVVPTAAGAYRGQVGGFLMLRFPAAPVVVHVEMLSSGVFYDDPNLTSPYEDAVTQLDDVAMSETESARLIETIRKELEG
jgi:transcriptional regulator with XRE-family HTH domain